MTLNSTPVIIYDSVRYIGVEARDSNRTSVMNFVTGWNSAWNEGDSGAIKSYYSENFASYGHGKSSWIRNESEIVQDAEEISLEPETVQILDAGEYVLAVFSQHLKFERGNDTEIKWLYIKDGEQGLKILAEEVLLSSPEI